MASASWDEWVGLVLGWFCLFYSFRVGFAFVRRPSHTSRLIGWQVFSEFWFSLCVMAFTLGDFFGCLEHWPQWLKSGMRLSMFGAGFLTTFKLSRNLNL